MSLPLSVVVVPVTPLRQNCTLYRCAKTGRGAVVDPGGDLDQVLGAAQEADITLERILLTHGHIDHAGGVAALVARTGLPVEGPHRDDAFWIDGIETAGQAYGITARRFTPDRWLENGDTVGFGEITMNVLHCPGHTPGHVVFHHPETRLASVGDVLFRGSIGRTDFPRGDHETLLRSIRDQLWPLGDDVTFIPGHGPLSTFGEERRDNPFVGDHVMG